MAGAILAIGILVFLAHFFVAVFRKTRVPDVLLLMGLGLLLGPVLHVVTAADFGIVGNVMSTLALVVILFESGITIDPIVMARSVRSTLALTFPTFVFTFLCAGVIAVYGLGLSPAVGWMAGATLGAVSAAVVIPLAKSVGIREPLGTAVVMESALGDVLSIVILLGVVQAAVSGQVAPARIAGTVIASLAMAGVIGVLGGVGWLLVLNRVRQFPNTAFTTLAVVFILYGAADELGFSGAIAALAFGATLTNHQHMGWTRIEALRSAQLGRLDEGDVSFFMEILFLLKTFFFVYLGVSIEFQDPMLFYWSLAFCGAVYLARLLIVRFAVPRATAPWQDLSIASILVPKGLVSAVLAGIPLELGIEGAQTLRDFAYMVVLASITLTAVLIPLMERRPLAGFYKSLFGTPEAPLPAPSPPAATSG
jgi:NhaP-type Na+/H+ or K+/H+ antiporter